MDRLPHQSTFFGFPPLPIVVAVAEISKVSRMPPSSSSSSSPSSSSSSSSSSQLRLPRSALVEEYDAASALVGLCSSPPSSSAVAVPPPPPVWSEAVHREEEEGRQKQRRCRQQHPEAGCLLARTIAKEGNADAEANATDDNGAMSFRTSCLAERGAADSHGGGDDDEVTSETTDDETQGEKKKTCGTKKSATTTGDNKKKNREGDSSNNSQKGDSYFPVVLMSIVNDPINSDVISWTPDGLAIVVRRPFDLAENVLPRYFQGRTGKYCSFARKLHRYGFRRTAAVDLYDRNEFVNTAPAYHYAAGGREDVFGHELFLRDAPALCREIRATSCSAPAKSSICKRNQKEDNNELVVEFSSAPCAPLCSSSPSVMTKRTTTNNATKKKKRVQWRSEFQAREFVATDSPSSPSVPSFDDAPTTAPASAAAASIATAVSPSPPQQLRPRLQRPHHLDFLPRDASAAATNVSEPLALAAGSALADSSDESASFIDNEHLLLCGDNEARHRLLLHRRAISQASLEALSRLDPRELSEVIARYDPFGRDARDVLRRAISVLPPESVTRQGGC